MPIPLRRRVLATLAALVLPSSAAPAGGQDAAGASAPAASPIAIRWNVEVIGAARVTDAAETPVNPGNLVLRLAGASGVLDARGNVRIEAGSRLSVIVRPRMRGSIDRVTLSGLESQTERDFEWQFPEAFATWRVNDALAIAYGLQNFQWGPAELAGPSNGVFHESGVFRDPLYSVRGRHLLRANISAGRQWSVVALAEISHNGAPASEASRAQAPFARQGLAKLEFSAADGGRFAGVTAGVVDGGRPWFGGYAMWTASDAVALYVDGSLASGSSAWYPQPIVQTGAVPAVATRAGFEQTRDGRGHLAFVVVGGRYTLARGDELRLEWLHQDAGYSTDELRRAETTLLLSRDRAQVDRWFAPGLEFLGRDLVLASARLPDLGRARRATVQARYLTSLTDRSGVGFVTATHEIGDAITAFTTLAATHGSSHAEFGRLVRASASAGVVCSF